MITTLGIYRSIRWASASHLYRVFLQFIQIMVLARLLQPSDFGISAFVLTVCGLVGLLADLGCTKMIFSRSVPSPRLLASVYWLNVAFAIALALLLQQISLVIYESFGDSVVLVLSQFSWIIVLNSLSLLPRKLAEKNMSFFGLAIVDFISLTIGFIVAVTLAVYESGYWSVLIASSVVSAISGVAVLMFVAGGDFYKGRSSFGLAWAMVMRSYASFLEEYVNSFRNSLDILIGGVIIDGADLGVYSVVKDICMRASSLFNGILSRVSLPVMAGIKGCGDKIRLVYLSALRGGAVVNASLFLFLIIWSEEILLALMGYDWGEAYWIFMAMSLWGWLRSSMNLNGSLIYAFGAPEVALRWNLFLLILYAPLLFLAAFFFGFSGYLFWIVIFQVLVIYPGWKCVINRFVDCSFIEFLTAFIWPLILLIPALIACLFLPEGGRNVWVQLLIAAVVYFVLYLIALYLFERKLFNQFLGVFCAPRT